MSFFQTSLIKKIIYCRYQLHVMVSQTHSLQNERYSAGEVGAAPIDGGVDTFTVNPCILQQKPWITTQ